MVRTRQRSESVTRAATTAHSRHKRVPFIIILSIVIGLSLLGLTMVLSASSVTSLTRSGSPWGEFNSQLMWLAVGLVAMFTATLIDHNHLRKLTLPGLVISTVLLIGVLIPGLGVSWKGAQRWIRLGPVQFQPSEVAKLALVLYAAHVLSRSKTVDVNKSVKPIVVVLIGFGGLILLQPNLGTTIIVFSIAIAILFASGAPVRVIAPSAASAFSVHRCWRTSRPIAASGCLRSSTPGRIRSATDIRRFSRWSAWPMVGFVESESARAEESSDSSPRHTTTSYSL